MDVLVVEDSELLRDELEQLLVASPAVDRVLAASGVAEARDRIRADAFDVWVLDFQLGDGTAIDLLADLDARGPRSRPFVAVVTNYSSPFLGERCIEAGADRFFDKSREMDELVVAVEEQTARADR